MNLKLHSRSETAGNDKMQLNFAEDAAMPAMGGGIQLTGWFDREVAMTYTVGASYELALTPVA